MSIVSRGTLALALLVTPAAAADLSVYDGDTITIDGEKIRVMGVDTPELSPRARCEAEERLARAAKRFVVDTLAGASIALERAGYDRYGRTLARVYVNGTDLALMLIEARHGRPYDGGKRKGWC